MSPIFLGNGESKAAVAMGIFVFASGNSSIRYYPPIDLGDYIDGLIFLNAVKYFSDPLGLLTTSELLVKPGVKLRLSIVPLFVH